MSKFISNSFQVPNAVVDELMADISGNELKCYLIIVRKTKGWQKQEDAISLSQFEELTKLSRSVIVNCCKLLEEKGVIESRKGYRNTTVFRLKESTGEETEPVKNLNQSLVKKLNRSSEEIELVTSSESQHTKDNFKNNIQKEKINKKVMFDPMTEKPNNVSFACWQSWIEYKKAKKHTLTEKSWQAQRRMLESHHDPEIVVNNSIMNGWQGLFPDKVGNTKKYSINDIDGKNYSDNPLGFKVING